ncbi:MAG: M20/M25/M40 family metallo-hydrolase, partial [Verrucomicrobiota bacterium]
VKFSELATGARNLMVIHEVDSKAPWLLFDSHLDTVDVAGMTIPPFEPTIREGKLYGRGSCDTKGTGAAMLFALYHYSKQQNQPNNIVLLFSSDEEIKKTGAKHFAVQDLKSLGITLAVAYIGEPTRFSPMIVHNGYLRWTIETKGRAAHSSNPAKGISAIRGMCQVIAAIEEYILSLAKKTPHVLTGFPQCSINTIHGGVQVNIIPDTCSIEIDRRLIPGETPDSVKETFEKMFETLRQQNPELKVSQKNFHEDPPMVDLVSGKLLPQVQSLLKVRGIDPKPCGAPFTTNGSTYADIGIPTIVMGPGDLAQAHTVDEYVEVSQVELGVEIYRDLMSLV